MCEARIETQRTTVDEAWRSAVDELNVWLGSRASDCAEIVILPDADGGARVQLTIGDGRSALRWIAHPVELGPAVRALLVRAPAVAKPDLRTPDPSWDEIPVDAEPQAAPVYTSPARSEAVERTTAPSNTSLVLSVAAGLGFPAQEFAGAVGQVRASVVRDRWELGGFGHWELTRHVTDDGSLHHATLASIGGGASGGRREPLGPILLVFGGTLAIHSNRSSFRDSKADIREQLVVPRAGGYIGAVFPKTAPVRVRTELAGELALSGQTPKDPRLPEMPMWWSGLTIGVEIGVSP